ncbi:MAG: PilZ domain-containing protein [Myxococcales bacterium]
MTEQPKRRWPRLHHEVMVSVETDKHGGFSGWSTSVSEGGCFVNSPLAPPVGERVSVLLQLPGQPECKLFGRVVWSQPAGPAADEPGMGIEFIETDGPTRALLGRVIRQLTQDLTAAPA